MRRFLLGFALLGWLACSAASSYAQDKVIFRDNTKKDKGTPEVNGTIKEESANGIVVKPNIGADKTIPAADVIDVVYQVKVDIRPDYRKADTADRVVAAKETRGSAKRNAALAEALAEYQKLLPKLAGQAMIERHIKYKIATIQAELAGDDKAKIKTAIDGLAAFQKDNPNAWQLIGCIGTLSDLYLEVGEFEKAAAAFETLKKVPGISAETKAECDRKALSAFVRAKKYTEAIDRGTALLKTMDRAKPEYKRMEMDLIAWKANTPPKFKEAVTELEKRIVSSKDPAETAMLYNTLGDCYMINNQPKDAMWQYMWVDTIYSSDRGEHEKAVRQLSQIFKDLRQPDKAKEYADKLDKLKR